MKFLLFILLLLFVCIIFYFNNKIKNIKKEKYNELGKKCQLKTNEINEKQKIIEQKEEELFNLRMKQATGSLENSARINELRKDVARCKTILREREIEG